MILPFAQITGAMAGSNELRSWMQGLLLDVDGKRVIATNGKIIASIPCEVSAVDVSGLIPEEAIILAIQLFERNDEMPCIDCFETECVMLGGTVRISRNHATHAIDRVLPQAKTIADADNTLPGRPFLCFDAQFLLSLVQAMQSDGTMVRLYLPTDANSAMRVEPEPRRGRPQSGSYGHIMPCRPGSYVEGEPVAYNQLVSKAQQGGRIVMGKIKVGSAVLIAVKHGPEINNGKSGTVIEYFMDCPGCGEKVWGVQATNGPFVAFHGLLRLPVAMFHDSELIPIDPDEHTDGEGSGEPVDRKVTA